MAVRSTSTYAMATLARTMLRSPLYDRAAMLARLPLLARKRDARSTALAHAVRGAALNRLRPDEREWAVRVEARRSALAADASMVRPGFEAQPATDGVGFRDGGEPAPIWGIAELFSISRTWGEFLLRLVRELAPRSSIELGTALGLSTAYQAAALELNDSGTLTTFEGAKAWAAVAEQGLRGLGLSDHASVEVGAIEQTLPPFLARSDAIDYAYLDADHTEEATVKHFDAILPHMAPGAVAVLDDIAFSTAMARAWHAIRSRDRVSTSLALGRMGVVTID